MPRGHRRPIHSFVSSILDPVAQNFAVSAEAVKEILRLAEEGLPLAEIADQIGCSPSTVARHIKQQKEILKLKPRSKL